MTLLRRIAGFFGLGSGASEGGARHNARTVSVDFDDEGISTNFHATETQALAWNSVSGIFIIRTSLGPFQKETFWCFASAQVELILSVPADADGLEALAEELSQRFDGIDFSALEGDGAKQPVILLWGEIPEM